MLGDPVEACLLLPCLDEGPSLGKFLAECRRTLEHDVRRWRIIVVDNDSSDDSAQIARDQDVRVVHVAERGYGAAVHAGIVAADAPWVVLLDADGTYDPRDATALLARAMAGDADLVMGSRLRGAIQHGAMPALHRYVGTPVLTGLVRGVFGAPISDVNCGLRAIRRAAYDHWHVRARGMEYASEVVIAAALAGARIVEHPVSLRHPAAVRDPHLRPLRDGLRHLSVIARRAPAAWRRRRI